MSLLNPSQQYDAKCPTCEQEFRYYTSEMRKVNKDSYGDLYGRLTCTCCNTKFTVWPNGQPGLDKHNAEEKIREDAIRPYKHYQELADAWNMEMYYRLSHDAWAELRHSVQARANKSDTPYTLSPINTPLMDAFRGEWVKTGQCGSTATTKWHAGLKFRLGSFWIGWHYSKQNKRLCVNLLPFVTFWITKPGGITP